MSETELGKFKCETLKWPDGITEVIAGRKAYVNVTAAAPVVKNKGVPTPAIDARAYAVAIENGHPYRAEYQAPSKIRTAVKSEVNANKFVDKFRTVKREQSSYQKGILR
jgi:hypothetical protein